MPARLVVLGACLAALLLPSAAPADNPVLDGFVGANDAFSIRLQDANGARVDHLDAGTYTIKVLISDAGGSNVSARTTATVGAAFAINLGPLSTGSTVFDSNQAALAAVLADWTSQDHYATRIANLLGTGSGSTLNHGTNANYFLQPHTAVFDDGVQNQLNGSAGQDWFFASLFSSGVLEKITDLGNKKIGTDL